MFHAILCTSIAVFGMGAKARADGPVPKDLKEEVADLNRQLTEAKKLMQDLRDEKTILQTDLENEKVAMQKRTIALEQAAVVVARDRDASQAKLQAQVAANHSLAQSIQAVNENFGTLRTQIDLMRKEIDVAVEQRNQIQKKLMDATDLLNNTAAERERLEKLGTQLVAEVLKMKQLVVDEQDKLVEKTAEADARKALFDRLAKAAREKRYDDALKLIEENDKANAAPKTDARRKRALAPEALKTSRRSKGSRRNNFCKIVGLHSRSARSTVRPGDILHGPPPPADPARPATLRRTLANAVPRPFPRSR